MENKSGFIPTACSTVSKKKAQRNFSQNSVFDEDNSLFPMSMSQLQEKDLSEVSYELEAQKQLAQTSLQRANKVAAIPSKYLRKNHSKSEIATTMCNESTVSESDLLYTPKSASTPRNSIQSLEQLSYKLTNSNLSIDNWVDDFKKVIKSTGDTSCIFKPGEEVASMLLADEISWRQKNEIPIQDQQFSIHQNTGNESVSNFFQQRCDTLSEFPGGESPNTTREPVPLIQSMSVLSTADTKSILEEVSYNENPKKISVSMIQKYLAESNDSPKSASNNIYKLCEDTKFVSLENKPYNSLPVSKNSSYTSDHSENSAIKHIYNKENIDFLNTKPSNNEQCSSQSSSRSSSALSSLQNGKLPIETTKCELIWGCVKLGKSATQEFIIRNKSAKRIGIQLSLSSQEFKIRKDNRNDSEPLSSIKLLLHAHESKVIIVSFIPTKRGAAVDELNFTSLEHLAQTKKQSVRLFGYGGTFKVDFYNLTRDTTGKFWMSLGKLDDRTLISSSFKVKNTGDLPIFIYISIHSLDACKICINPNLFVLMPQMQKEITISYRPSSEDYQFINKSVNNPVITDLGNLLVTFGTEVDRGRLRKICERNTESDFKEESLVTILKEKIEGEIMPIDLLKFKESPSNIKEILKLFKHHQIILTLERDPEQTIIQQYSDDSGLYQSLYQDTTLVASKSDASKCCYIAPLMILLTLPYKYKDTVFLKSESDYRLNFKISSQNQLEVKPKEGVLEPHGTVILSIKYCSNTSEKKSLKVIVAIEKELFEVEVKVESLGNTKNKNKSILNCL